MSAAPNSGAPYSPYKVTGGSLDFNHPSYVVRQADKDLWDWLKRGEFCYVLNSRQMGKSSLRIRTMYKLREAGIACAEVDLTGIDNHKTTTPEQWYGGICRELKSSLELEINSLTWWRAHQDLAPMQRFSEFLEKIVLAEFNQKIIIFVDEIDSVLKLEFKEDFFALIRVCYEKRATRPMYRRLSFVLLGVAKPSDLIRDISRTPFNIGQAIELKGFQLNETKPLKEQLEGKTSNPDAVLREVLFWTNGQPFLTQKLCHMLWISPSPIKSGDEAEEIKNLVQKCVVGNWETHDDPEHFKTLRDRLLRSDQLAIRLLSLYQEILNNGEIETDDSSEQMELRLSGLVVEQEGKLKVYNPIYASIFNQNWVDKALVKLRPYGEALKAWVASNYQDKSRLLRGEELQDALTWAAGRRLSAQDDKFLGASKEAERIWFRPHWLLALQIALGLGLLLVPIISWVVNDKDSYRLQKDGSIWHDSVKLDNNPKTVAIDADRNGLYQLHDSGWIWRYTGTPCNNDLKLECPGWEKLNNNPKTIAIDANGNELYQLHIDGSIWQYTGTPCNNNECLGWVELGNEQLIGKTDFRWEFTKWKTMAQFNFETPEEGWWVTGSAGLDFDRGFEHSGRGNGWIRNTSGWNAINNSFVVEPNSECKMNAWLRTSDTLTDGYMSVRPYNSDGSVIKEIKLVGAGSPNPQNRHYNFYTFNFNSGSSNKILFYVGLFGNGRDAWIQVDDAAVSCGYSNSNILKSNFSGPLVEGMIIQLQTLGDINGLRWLDGRTADATIGLVSNENRSFSGTKWRVHKFNDSDIALESMGEINGLRWLDGKTADATVGLAPRGDGSFSGAVWKVHRINDSDIMLESLGTIEGPRWLDGRTASGTVGLVSSENRGSSGTKWRIVVE